MDLTSMIAAGGSLAIIGTAWERIKKLYNTISSYFIYHVKYIKADRDKAEPLVWKIRKGKKFYDPIIFNDYFYIYDTMTRDYISMEVGSKSYLIAFIGKCPVIYTINNKEITFTFPRWFMSPSSFNEIMMKEFKKTMNKFHDYYDDTDITSLNRFEVSYIIGNLCKIDKDMKLTNSKNVDTPKVENDNDDNDDLLCLSTSCYAVKKLGIPISHSFDDIIRIKSGSQEKYEIPYNIALTKDLELLLNKLEFWYKNKEWFISRCITWKRGIVLHGKPGTGKTTFIRTLGQYLGMPIVIFDLLSMTNYDFRHEYETSMKYSAPLIMVFEDFHTVFDGKKNLASSTLSGSPLTFNCLLNTLDGIEKTDGIITIITTNDYEKIDEALGGKGNTRPGRIDYIIEVKNPDNEGYKKIASSIILDDSELIDNLVKNRGNSTPAQFKERCILQCLEVFENKIAKKI
jgi:hypothetical protein